MNSTLKKLISPENYLSDKQGLILGLIVSLVLGGVGAASHIVLDGVLDLHQHSSLSLPLSMATQFINWFCLVLCLFVAAKLFQSKIRWIDLAGILGVIKVWYIFPMLYVLLFPFQINPQEILQNKISPAVILFGLVSSVFFFIYIFYLFRAYRVNSNLSDGKLVLSFIAGLLTAEILSKLFISFISKIFVL